LYHQEILGQCKSLTQARGTIPALKAVQVHVLQQTLKRLERAFVKMWEQKHGFPRFKKVGNRRSFVFPQMGVEPIKNSAVKLPKIGWVQFRQSREIPSDAILKQVRAVKRVSGWYAMLALQWDVSIPDIIPQGNPVGIDVGLTNFIASSDGLLTKRPKFFIDAERKLKLLQKSVSKKRIGSNNWKRAAEKSCTAARVRSQLPKRLASQAITQNLR
jgi:putative transposase